MNIRETRVCIICGERLPLKVFRRMRLGEVTYNNRCNSCRNRLYREKYAKDTSPRYTTDWPCTHPGCGLHLASAEALEWHLKHFHLPKGDLAHLK